MAVLLSVVMAPFGAIADPEFFDEGPMAGRGYPFSESVRVGNILFISGQVGVDENNELVEGGIVGETRQIMSNIGGALEREGWAFPMWLSAPYFWPMSRSGASSIPFTQAILSRRIRLDLPSVPMA